MRGFLGFAAGSVVSAVTWVILDLQTSSITPYAPPIVGDSGKLVRAEECEPPSRHRRQRPAQRSMSPRDDVVHATVIRGLPAADLRDEPWPRRAEPTSAARPRRSPRRPTIEVAAGAGVEVPLTGRFDDAAELVGARVLVEIDRRLGVELGLARGLGRDHSSTFVDGALRWSFRSRSPLKPYAAVGLGWRRMHRMQPDDDLTVPVSVGLAYRRGYWLADGRLTVRPTLRGDRPTASATVFVGLTF